MDTFISDISKKKFPKSEQVRGKAVRESVLRVIQQQHPDFDHTKMLALSELNDFREQYMADYLSREVGRLSKLDKKVLQSIKEHTIISDLPADDETKLTVGQRVADKVASFGGSWTFISLFGGFIVLWMLLNIVLLLNDGFDPYPFILLNLILSCLAAVQAPIIMMSQNRQGEKDRERAREDYMVNLKSELEIKALHEKIDHLMMYQQQELIELQKIQIDMLKEIQKRIDKRTRQSDTPRIPKDTAKEG